MMIFGHLGIGSFLSAPFRRGLPMRWILLGTLLPDLIDKPLYYGLSFATGKHAAELGLISGTRTFGHTALLLVAMLLIALAAKNRVLAALSIGAATHLLLDGLSDQYIRAATGVNPESALLWPFFTQHFPVMPFDSLQAHVAHYQNPFTVGTEVGGVALLSWDLWKNRHRSEVLRFFRERRQARRLRKKMRKPT